MKTNVNPLILGFFVLSLSASSLAACAHATTGVATTSKPVTDTNKIAVITPMRQMMSRLTKLEPTGDPDFDYALQARVQTQGQLDLLKQEAQSGKDTSLRKMAQTMIPTVQADIDMINNLARQLRPSRPNQAFMQAQNQNIKAMALKFQAGGNTENKLTSNFDDNFVTVMLDQRQDAIDLANTYLKYGSNDTLKKYAQDLTTKAQQQMNSIKQTIK